MGYLKNVAAVSVLGILLVLMAPGGYSQEVEKGKIPKEHINDTLKKLPWGVAVWDVKEALEAMNSDKEILWVDTRPESFWQKGTLNGAVNLIYNEAGSKENTLTKESILKAVSDLKLNKEKVLIVMFCQGPGCHRSYNATFTAVSQWGFKPAQVIWFREGYPNFFAKIKDTPLLKRKARKYLSAEGIKQLL